MSFPQGIDFRSTAGFVTDPTNCDAITTTAYPHTTAQGNTVGWEDAVNGIDSSAFTGNSAKVAGINYVNGQGTVRFRVDISTGSYKFRTAAGYQGGSGFPVEVELFDTTTSLGSLVTFHTTATANTYYDATDVLRTSNTDWVSNNALSGSYSFSTTICRFKMGQSSGFNTLVAHFWIESASSGGSVGGGSDTLQSIKESGFASAGALGNALDILKVISETATGKIGAKAGGLDTLKPITESATGTVLTNITASGIDQFRAILEQSTALAGAKGFALDTLKHLTGSATGQISTNAAIGYGLDQLKPITETATAKAGATASAKGTFRAVTESATANAGAIGSILNTLNPIRSQGFGVSAAPSIQPGPSPFGGFVSYDYQTATSEPLPPLEPVEPMDIKAELPVLKHVPFTPDYKPLKQKVSAKVAKEMKTFWEEKKENDERAILEDDEQVIMAVSRFFMDNRF